MCGFVAFVGSVPNRPTPDIIDSMLHVIQHRGPDDSGVYFESNVGFGFRRLSILDLSPAGHQPMSNADASCTIVFNGEIYNYVELRRELIARGHTFCSSTDTEVLLHAYLEWGDDCVTRLEGMWAFLIHDRRTGRVFGSRDRFGMKPLFMHQTSEGMFFASEIKSIRASGLYSDALNLQVCARFFHEGRLDDRVESFFSGIRSIEPGHGFEITQSGVFKTWPFWAINANSGATGDIAEAYAELFEKSVAKHMRSDVPLGVNLSGGMDSTAILCAIARQRANKNHPLKAFSFAAPGFDESEYIEATLEQTGARRETLMLSPQALWDSLETVLWFQDEPVHSLTAVVGYHLSGLAASHGVKVILNGQGADETLAGYPSYFRDYWYSLLWSGRLKMLWHELGFFEELHGGLRMARFLDLARHAVQTELRKSPRYRRLARMRKLGCFKANDWLAPELADALPKEDEFEPADLDATLVRATCSDPLPLYLRVEDRNAMAHSVEARLPFLNPDVVKFAFTLPPEWKMRGGWNKFVLREAMRNRIPEIVRTRPDKMGFPTPFSKWLRADLYESARMVIEDASFAQEGLFRVDSIRRDLERHRRGEIDIASRLFDVVQFHLWRGLDPTQRPAQVHGAL